jgi:tetratricopeptide (TPR) repeat protein
VRRLLWWQLPLLLFAAAGAIAQVQPSGPEQTPASSADTKQQVTIQAPREQALPELRSDEFTRCMGMVGYETVDYTQAVICEAQLSREKHIVVEACINKKGDTAPRRVVQACTESLDADIFEGSARYFLFASRAAGYFAQGDKQHARDDYDEAVKLAPRNPYLYYNRGVFYAAQADSAAALRDFDTAIGINATLVPALRQRARIYQARGEFTQARQDYSRAIELEPKAPALWSERGYVSLRQQDYESAEKDEAEAIRLDPKLARAYFLHGAATALGRVGDSHNAVDDIKTAVSLDPSLASYVRLKGKSVSLALPPL